MKMAHAKLIAQTRMLEMDLQAQSGAIWETENGEDTLTEHNRKILQKMKEQRISWAESYPEEMNPISQEKN